MEMLLIPGIIVFTLIYLVLRPDRNRGRGASSSWAVVGMTALFFVLAGVIFVAFFLFPPLRDWLNGLIGPGPQGDAFGFGRLGLYFIYAGGLSMLASLPIVLVLSFALKRRQEKSSASPAGRSRRE